MRIALVQTEACTEDFKKNEEVIFSWIDKGINEKADLICFPEMTLCGYSLQNISRREEAQRPLLKKLLKKTKETCITVCIGGIELCGASYYITHYVISDRIYGYRKTHPGEKESEFFVPGEEIPVFTAGEMKFGIMTCYDGHFPELATLMAQKGAEVIFNPSAVPQKSSHRLELWNRYLGARAYDNRVWVMALNLISRGKGGGMACYNPEGERVSSFNGSESHMIFLDYPEKKNRKELKNFLKDRREELYHISRCTDGMVKQGFTTGSACAAAVKGAVKSLFTGTIPGEIIIDTPRGTPLRVKSESGSITGNSALVSVRKNLSDDPDVTKGLLITAHAKRCLEPGIHFKKGKGIGIVTKRGLPVPQGEPAVNPVPRAMIIKEAEKVLPEGEGVLVTLSVPLGEETAVATFNPRLGIEGGISILGTSGYVEPMSEEAYKESLKLELKVKTAWGQRDLFPFVFGNFGRDYLTDKGVPENRIVKTSNFIAYMMKCAGELGIKRVLITGHTGKMVKVAQKRENTHSALGDFRMEAINESLPPGMEELQKRVLQCNTTDEAMELLREKGIHKNVFRDIALRCKEACEEWSRGKTQVEVILFTKIYGEVAATDSAGKWLKELKQW